MTRTITKSRTVKTSRTTTKSRKSREAAADRAAELLSQSIRCGLPFARRDYDRIVAATMGDRTATPTDDFICHYYNRVLDSLLPKLRKSDAEKYREICLTSYMIQSHVSAHEEYSDENLDQCAEYALLKAVGDWPGESGTSQNLWLHCAVSLVTDSAVSGISLKLIDKARREAAAATVKVFPECSKTDLQIADARLAARLKLSGVRNYSRDIPFAAAQLVAAEKEFAAAEAAGTL